MVVPPRYVVHVVIKMGVIIDFPYLELKQQTPHAVIKFTQLLIDLMINVRRYEV